MMETKCVGGLSHTEVISADEEGTFDPQYVSVLDIAADVQAHPAQFGYCSRCYTAMRFDTGMQRWVDLPQANRTPHCAWCAKSITFGAHYLTGVSLDISTLMDPRVSITDVYVPPLYSNASFCGPMCVLYMLMDHERLRDAFGQ